MIRIAPKDLLEGMLAAQMVAIQSAALECYRRGMLKEQTLANYDCNLRRAVKLTRVYAELMQALDKHRGKGRQKVVVEHVHVDPGGQAIVGNVGARGGVPKNLEDQSHARTITHEEQVWTNLCTSLASRILVAKGFPVVVGRRPAEEPIRSAEWRLLRFEEPKYGGQRVQAKNSSRCYEGIAIGKVRRWPF